MASAFSESSAALLKAISSPLKGLKRQSEEPVGVGQSGATERLGIIIESEFIPRLMMRYAHGAAGKPTDEMVTLSEQEVAAFAPLPLTLEADALLAEVETYLDRGVGVETVLVGMLAPSARELGRQWEEDECDFVEVTMGLWRLQEVMREIAARSPPVIHAIDGQRTALFSPVPGDQHSFGALMVEEIFARAGWKSEALIDPERRELLRIVSENSFDLVGLTVTSDCHSGALSKLVSAIRTVSANPRTRILIGGRAVNENPCLVTEASADGTATDAEAALELAASLVEDARLSA